MLSRFAIASIVLVLFGTLSFAQNHDYLQRGEEHLTSDYQIKYDRAVRHVLARGWRKDIVLRMVNIPPFQPESVAGIARTSTGYSAFEATASKHIWAVLDFDHKQGKGDYRSVRPLLHERVLSASLAARIAALWRRVLADPRNYGKDPAMYLDTDHFSFYLAFLPHERMTAYMTGWGPHTWEVIGVAAALASHANGAPEGDLGKAVAKSERKLGI
jgi:hypothetical protein